MASQSKLLFVPFLLALVFSVCGNSCQAEEQVKSRNTEATVYKLCQQSQQLINNQSYAKACELLQEAARHDPTSNSKYVHSSLAQCYLKLGEYQKSMKEAQISLALDPKDRYSLYIMSKAYYEMGNFNASANYLTRYNSAEKSAAASEQSKRTACNMTAYANLLKASECIKLGKDVEATKLLQDTIDCDPSPVSAQAHASLSFVYKKRGYLQRAIEEGKKAIALNPNDKDTMYIIAMTYRDLARFDDAIKWTRQYLSLEADATKRQNAINYLSNLEQDKRNINNPDSRLPDYLDESLAQGHVSKWNQDKLPLKVYISSGSGIYGYRAYFPNVILSAFDTWCAASGKKLSYEVVRDNSKADISVKWTATPFPRQDSDHPNIKVAGITHFQHSDLGDIDQATITILTVSPFDTTRIVSSGECATVSTHEVGHALGLAHSSNIRDIMYFCTSNQQHGLSSRDKATIAKFYAGYPAISFAPKAKLTDGKPIEYLPPPTFMPPLPPDTSKLEPPLFIPPPAKSASQELQPPLFMPPALPKSKTLEPPLFMPPPK